MKRFTETTKWDDPWFQDLSPEHKLFWNYLCDNCDSTGVWKVNWRLAEFRLGFVLEKERVLIPFVKRVIPLDEERWLVIAFIPFQYGILSEGCRPHKPILALIKRHALEDTLERVSKGYRKGTNTLEEQDKYKDNTTGECEGGGAEDPFHDPPPKRDHSKLKKNRAENMEQCAAYAVSRGLLASDGEWFWEKCEGNGWKNNGHPIVDWQLTICSWKRIGVFPSQKQSSRNGAGRLPFGVPSPIETK